MKKLAAWATFIAMALAEPEVLTENVTKWSAD